MNVSVSREELAAVVAGVVPDNVKAAAAQLLADMAGNLTLADLYPAGLSTYGNDEEIRIRFANWQRSGTRCYASEAAAREAEPQCFRSVCTQWGRAGEINRTYRLADGMVVYCNGVWWNVPEPGGADQVFYLAHRPA